MKELGLAIVENLKSMGYDAELQTEPYKKGARAGKPRCDVHIKTGRPLNVFLDLLAEGKPQFRSFANYTADGIAEHEGFKRADWIINKKEGGLEQYNKEQGFREGLAFKGPMIAAYVTADAGLDLAKIADIFRLNRKGKGAEVEADLGEGFDAATDFGTSATPAVSTPERKATATPPGLGK